MQYLHEEFKEKCISSADVEMKHPLISVIIPAYNSAGYLGRCLDSIINQTYKNLEIIVVNDGSTDETRQIAEEYASRDSRIKVIHQANKGQVAARKAGLEIASGEYISAVDSDDWIALNRYEDVYKKGISAGADVISADVCNVYDENHIVPVKASLRKKIYNKKEILEGILMKMIDEDHFYSAVMNFTNWNLVVRSRIALKRQLAIDDRISAREGAVYVIGCLIDADKLAVINGGNYFYVKRSDSFDHKYDPANKEKLQIAHTALRNYVKEIPDKYRERYFREMDLFEYHSYLISDYDYLCRETDEMIFPFHVKKGKNIVVYGAGTLGSNIVRHMEKEAEKPILWCDKSYIKYAQEGKEICSPEEILKISDTIDAVLICILNYQVAEKAKSELIDLGVEGSKIYLIDSSMLTMERMGRADSKEYDEQRDKLTGRI